MNVLSLSAGICFALMPCVEAAISLAGEGVDADVISAAGPVDAAMRAFEAGRHDEAVRLATPLAADGLADALYLLGFAHETGQGAPQSREKAMGYYRKAMEKSQSDAAYRLSFLLMASEEKKDLEEALNVLTKKAVTDVAVAGRVLGEGFLLGRFGDDPDVKKGIEWWEKSAAAEDAASMILLARLYDGQMGFPDKVDAEKATSYFLKAAEAGDAGAMVAVGSRLLNGKGKSGRDEKAGREWLERALDQGDVTAHLVLGDFEETVKDNLAAALAHYERGKDAGQVDCILRTADFYLEGKGVEKDERRGLKLFESAAKDGNGFAHFRLAVHEMNGEKPDVLRGYGHLVAAAEGGVPEAQNELGLFYLSGRLAVADTAAAVSWFTRAAQAGLAAAQNNLGALHERGAGVPQSFGNAGRLYEMASNQGHPAATLAMARLLAAGAGTEKNLSRAWVMASLADEMEAENAKAILEEIVKTMGEDELKGAKKQLEEMKAGKAKGKR